MKKFEGEFFQKGGYDDTIAAFNAEFMKGHPTVTIISTKFNYAHPGRPGEGRWVGMELIYTEAKK